VEAGRSQLEGAGLLDGADPPDPLPVTTTTGIADAVAGAGFVIEAVVEDLRAKKAVLAAAEPSVGATTLLSSTTSALSPRAIQSDLKEPQRFVVAHYAQPAHLMRLVEVVPGAETDEAAVKACCDLLEATGKLPVRCPDIPGFLWARIQHAILREFAGLVGRGLTTPEACDLVLKEGYAVRLPAMGSFEHADLAGLDLMNSEASRAVWADLCNAREPDETPVGQLFRQGHRGMSSGHGFYDWTERDAAAFRAARDEVILRRLKESPAR
jgi:3-hydroxybutyryl-CoA dehydrogenase